MQNNIISKNILGLPETTQRVNAGMAALTEEQTLIRDQAEAWVRDEFPVTKFRAMRDSKADGAIMGDAWQGMVEMGWTGILVPEAHVGSDLGYLTFGLVLEALGKNLTASPLLASALVGASALRLAGSEAQQPPCSPAWSTAPSSFPSRWTKGRGMTRPKRRARRRRKAMASC